MSIKLENIWFRYPRSERWALEGISITFKEGEISVIIGPNGSGKTTLLKIASLLYKPSKGSVKLWGRDFWTLDKAERISFRRRLVYIHEKPILLKGTALYNIAYPLLLRGFPRDDALDLGRRLLERFGISSLADKPASTLSAGEAQLTSILRAVAINPRFLFLDEPLAHLDLEKRSLVTSVMKELAKSGAGIVIATHDYSLAYSISDRVVLLEEGRIAAEGGVAEIFKRKA